MSIYRTPCSVTDPDQYFDRYDASEKLMASERLRITTEYGTYHRTGCDYRLTCNTRQAYAWAHRSRNAWPCSTLKYRSADHGTLSFTFASNGDLIDMSPSTADIDGHELDAWQSDVLNEALSKVEQRRVGIGPVH